MKRFYLAVNVLCSIGFIALIYAAMSGEYIRYDNAMIESNDLYMPYITGYAFTQIGLHNNGVISAFGFVYSLINGLAFNFLDFFNLGLNKLPFTVSLFFFVIIVFVWSAIRIFTKYRIPYIFLLLFGILSVNFFEVSLFLKERHGLIWSSMYNANLWNLLYVHIALTLLIFKDRAFLKKISSKELYILAIIQTLFLFLTFNYKASYFSGAFLLSAALIPFFTRKNIIRYIASIFVLFISANLIISLIFNYDYIVYFEALKKASQAKLHFMFEIQPAFGRRFFKHLLYAPFLIAFITAILNNEKFIAFIREKKWKILSGLSDCFKEFGIREILEAIFMAVILWAVIFLAIQGNSIDGARMFIIPILLCLFVFLQYKHKKTIFVFCCALYFLYMNGLHITALAAPKNNADYKEVVLNNLNPKHILKFYAPEMRIRLKKPIAQKHQVNMSQVFDEIIQGYEKLKLTKDDKVLFTGVVNFAPFVLNSLFPYPSYTTSISAVASFGVTNSLYDADFYQRLIKGADIIIFMKESNRLNLKEEAVWEQHFKNMDEDYRQFYETDNMLFYAKQSWIDNRIDKGTSLPIIDKKGKGDILKSIETME